MSKVNFAIVACLLLMLGLASCKKSGNAAGKKVIKVKVARPRQIEYSTDYNIAHTTEGS